MELGNLGGVYVRKEKRVETKRDFGGKKSR